MRDDPYTLESRLCDDDGMVSEQKRSDWKPGQVETYLGLMNQMSRMTRQARDPEAEFHPAELFQCTGHAHLIGEHIRCTSPAHQVGERVRVTDPARRP